MNTAISHYFKCPVLFHYACCAILTCYAGCALIICCSGCATSVPPPKAPTLRKAQSTNDQSSSIQQLVQNAAKNYGLEEALLLGIIQVESSFRINACSPMGARGLMQLMPRTAESIAPKIGYSQFDIYDPAFNIEAGTYYIAHLMRLFDGDVRLALASYNNGSERVRKWLLQGQTFSSGAEQYVVAVLSARDNFRQGQMVMSSGKEKRPRDIRQHAGERGEVDRAGLLDLIRDKQRFYGDRPDEPISSSIPSSQPISSPSKSSEPSNEESVN